MKAKKLVAGILAVCFLFGGFLSNSRAVQVHAALPKTENVVSPRWVTVRKATASLGIFGKSATCEVSVEGMSNVSSIAGTLELTLVKTDGTVEQIASWYLTGGRNLGVTKTATVSSSGIYQLSFNGTATTKDGKTENITASDTKVY